MARGRKALHALDGCPGRVKLQEFSSKAKGLLAGLLPVMPARISQRAKMRRMTSSMGTS